MANEFFLLRELPKGLNKVEDQYIAAAIRSGYLRGLIGSYDIYGVDGGGLVIDVHANPKKDPRMLPTGAYLVK